jgi:hypothetical protein
MAKADIQPRWLVSLMCQWAVRQLAEQDGGLGYPKKVAFLLIPSGNDSHTDPTAQSAKDFADLSAALEACRAERLELWVTMMMYYKPWMVAALSAEGYPFGNSTYFKRLHIAHAWISSSICNSGEKKLATA